MSSGSFVRSKYQMTSPANVVVPIRVQPETLTLECDSVENEPPSGEITEGWPSARVSGGRRSLGIFARTCSFVITAQFPAGYKEGSVLTLPCLNRAFAAAVDSGKTGTYTVAGAARPVEFIGKPRAEVVR
jgi:hypothetical protein